MGVVEQMPQAREQAKPTEGANAPYDVVIIGAGPGGYVAAIRCGQLGLRTVVVEEGKVGGVCLNVGCIPSKAVISAAQEYKHALKGPDKGLNVRAEGVDMRKLVAWKQSVVDRLTGGVAGLLKANKVEVLQGRAVFTGPQSLDVATA